MMLLRAKVLCATLGLCVVMPAPLWAGEASKIPSKPVDVFLLPSGLLPSEIYGVPCVLEDGDKNFRPSIQCRGKDPMKDPSTSVVARESACDTPIEKAMEFRRNYMNDGTPFSKVVWEKPFAPESIPDAIGFKGFYQKSLGNRYWWEACGQGKLTSVLVIMFGPLDNDALKAEIEQKIYGVAPQTDLNLGK